MPIIVKQNTFQSHPIDDGNKASTAWSTGRWRNFVSQADIVSDISDPALRLGMLGAVEVNITSDIIGQATVNDEFNEGSGETYPNGIPVNPARWDTLSLSDTLVQTHTGYADALLSTAKSSQTNILRHRNPPFSGDFTFSYGSQQIIGNNEFGFRAVDSITGEMWRLGWTTIGDTRTMFEYWDGGSWTLVQSTGRSSGTFTYDLQRRSGVFSAFVNGFARGIAPIESTNDILVEFYHRCTDGTAKGCLTNYFRVSA